MRKIDITDSNNYVTCKICGKKLRCINIYHLKTHGITEDEYRLRYGGPMVCQNTMQSFVNTGKMSACKKKNRGYIYSVQEDEEMVKMYLNGDSIAKISKDLGRSEKTVANIVKRKGIDVSSNEARRTHTKYKKESKWSYEKCIEVAKQCSGRGEFRRKYQGAFSQAKKMGWYESLDQYYTGIMSHYNLDDKIHLIYAYEIEDEKAVYVGRTINLKARHANHKSKVNKDGDSLRNFCNEHFIEVPYPKILEEGLNAKESQEAEDKWIRIYENNGWNIINEAKTGKGSSSLGSFGVKWTYDACAEAARECKSKQEYKKRYGTASRVAITNGWIDDFFVNIKAPDGYYDEYEHCLEAAKGYDSMTNFRKAKPFVYSRVCKNGWNDKLYADMGWLKNKPLGTRKTDSFHINTLEKRINNFINTCRKLDINNRYNYDKVHELYKDNRTKVYIYDNVKQAGIYRIPTNHIQALKRLYR